MLISSLCSYFHPMNVFIWQKSHFVDKYVQNAKFSKWQKSNLHRALRGRTITAPHKSIEYIGLHMTIFLHNHTKMKLFTHWNVEIRSGTLLSSIYCIALRCNANDIISMKVLKYPKDDQLMQNENLWSR